MLISPTLQIECGTDLQTAAAALLAATEQPDIARWIEFPASLLVFLFVPGDADSGAIYILDRKKGAWYAIDFEDEQFGGYKLSQLDDLLHAFGFLGLVEQPGLWRGGLPWTLERGRRPEVRV
jgi:hypothetical protein